MAKPRTMLRVPMEQKFLDTIKKHCEKLTRQTGEKVDMASMTRQMWAAELDRPELAEGYQVGRPVKTQKREKKKCTR